MVQCKKYSESTAGNGTQQKTVIFTADVFTVYLHMKFLMNSVIRLIYGQDKGFFRASSENVPDY